MRGKPTERDRLLLEASRAELERMPKPRGPRGLQEATDKAWRELSERMPTRNASGQPIPKPWTNSSGPCPRILGITLHRPWCWAFFHGGPALWKDVENRGAAFPDVPAGTLLAIHSGQKWDQDSADELQRMLAEPAGLTLPKRAEWPGGRIVGVVRVAELTRMEWNPEKQPTHHASRWRSPSEVGVWLDERRHLLPSTVPCAQGWFGVWVLPEAVRQAVVAGLAERVRGPEGK